jgi:hypothetical protein
MPLPRSLWGAAFALALATVTASATAQRSAIPSPASVFGFALGTDSQLVDYGQSIEYFRRLERASQQLRLFKVGTTSFGRDWWVAVISTAANLARLERLRDISQRLAHPEGISDNEARRLAREGKVFVDISGGLHASEVAGAQHTPQLAYEILARAQEPEIREILENTVLFLWPSINPDGQDIVVSWCRERLAGRNPAPMELYQKYIGHDNNRDSYMLNVAESRVIARTWRQWEPQLVYVHHQSSPFPTRIWLPPFADPVGLYAPPIIARTVNAIGTYIAAALDAEGKPGSVHMLDSFDAWYPGYIDYMPVYQNVAAWWTETQGGNCGVPRVTTRDSLPVAYRDLRPKPLYLSPWAEGRWSLRDQVDYMVSASLATLRYAAKFREEILYNRYQAGRNTIAQYRKQPPYAYIVPRQQRDPMAPVQLLRRLAFLGVRVSELTKTVEYEGRELPPGTWVVPMDQEYAQLVRTLLEVQHYPDLGDDLPYDAAGWTLPYQMGVRVIEARSPLSERFRAALKLASGSVEPWGLSPDYPLTTDSIAAGIVPDPGGLVGSGSELALDPTQNNSFPFINRALDAGASLRFVPAGDSRPARYIVSGIPVEVARRWAAELYLQAELRRPEEVSSALPVATRIALYKAAPGNMDEGWTEWLLDTHEFRYAILGPSELASGNLGARFDVIVLGSQSVVAGRGGRGAGPAAISGSDSQRVEALLDFVSGGGTVVAWNQGASAAAAAFDLPLRNVVAGVGRAEFFTGGSIMRALVDTLHPVMAGMPDTADIFVNSSPVFQPLSGFGGRVLARYPTAQSPLHSGFLRGEKYLQGFAAAIAAKVGKGYFVLLGFQPQWRGQSTGTFRIVFNSLFFSRDLAASVTGSSSF